MPVSRAGAPGRRDRPERIGPGCAGADGFGRVSARYQSGGTPADAGARTLKFMVEIGSACGGPGGAMAKGGGR